MKIRAEILKGGKNAAGIHVPDEVVAALGPSRKPAVKATVNGYAYRSSLASMGGRFMLPVSQDVRAKAGVEAGQTVDLELELDTAPREVAVPADFTAALDAKPAARAFFDGLSYSNRLRHVLAIEAAKAEDTRNRRIEKSVASLADGKA